MLSSKMIFRASLIALLAGTAAHAQSDLAPPAPADAGVEVQSLEALDPLEVGLQGSLFSRTLWDGSDAAMARAALDRLPDGASGGYTSLATREIARLVLVAGGYPPDGGRGDEALAMSRADRLLAAGGAHDAFDLLERTPGLDRKAGLARMHAELGFALGETQRACDTANGLLEGRDQPYWLRARAVCSVFNDQAAAGELSAELAAAREPDAEFDRLLYAITLEQTIEGDFPTPVNGLNYALALAAPSTADGEWVRPGEAAPHWLVQIHEQRGAGDFSYSAAPAADLARAETLSGQSRHDVLISVLAQGEDRLLAAAALTALLDDAAEADDLPGAMRRFGGEVATLPMTEDTLADGYRFALAAILNGDLRIARRWRDAVLSGPARPEASMPALAASDFMSAGLEDKPGAETTAAPAAAEPVVEDAAWQPLPAAQLVILDMALALAADTVDSPAMEALLAAYLEGQGVEALGDILALERLGAPALPGVRPLLLQRETAGVPIELMAMEAAMQDGAVAETALLAAAALNAGEDGPSAETLVRTTVALDALGLRAAMLELLLERLVARAAG